MSSEEVPDGFILSDAAMYSFVCQDVFPDIISFAAAIPDHLKPLFLVPIKLEKVTTASEVARRIARRRYADGMTPTGDTPDADLFGTKTFVNDDNEPTVPSSSDGSIFRVDDADDMTKHQEDNYDENIQVPTDTSYNTDVDMTEYFEYPYRTDEGDNVRHSSTRILRPIVVRLALKPEILEPHAPAKVQQRARSCSVSLTSYDKRTRVFTFSVDCGNGAKTVQASLSDIDEVALICNCPNWQWGGPEHNAQSNSYLLGQPYGTAGPPDVRDPNREHWLCKHSYAVLRKLDNFVQEIVSENWEKDDQELLDEVDEEWDRLEGVAEVPMDEEEDEEIETDWEEEEEPEAEEVQEPEQVEEPAAAAAPDEEEQEQAEDYSGEEEGEPSEEESEEAEEDYSDEPQLKPVPMSPEEFQELSEEPGIDYSGEEPEEPEEPEEEPVDYSGDEDEEQEQGKK